MISNEEKNRKMENIYSHVLDLMRVITCPICLGFLNDPVASSACFHSFCSNCLVKAIEFKQTCPVCVRLCIKSDIIALSYAKSVISQTVELVEVLTSELSTYSGVTSTDFAAKSSSNALGCSRNIVVENRSIPFVVHNVGNVVHVTSRMWAGINKPGGTARVMAVKTVDDSEGQVNRQSDVMYDVKYVLASATEKNIPSSFVEAAEDLHKDRIERKRSAKGKQTIQFMSRCIYLDSC